MAKKKDIIETSASPQMKSGFDMKGLNKLNDLLNKISPDGGILNENSYTKIDEWIPTGSYILNAALSGSLFGGLPNRRSLGLAGVEGCLCEDETIKIYEFKNPNIKGSHNLIKNIKKIL